VAAPDEALLGNAEGYPVCKVAATAGLEQRCLVGNLSHFDEIAPAFRKLVDAL